MVDIVGGKESEFNWAALYVRSLDDLVGKMSELTLNLEHFDAEVGKYNYEIAAIILGNIFIRLWGHLKKSERDEGRELKEKLDKAVKYLTIFETKKIHSLSGVRDSRHINYDNLEIISMLLFEFQLEIIDWIEKHKLGTPAKKDPSKAVIDF